MLNKLTITLGAVLVFGTASGALTQEFDPNSGNRYPAFNGPVVGDRYDGAAGAFQTHRMAPARSREVNLPFGAREPRTTRTPRYDSAPAISGGGY